ncbi:hypothetical protein EJ08DRAFT_676382 [Tothia fuscella]|uniref:Uncharacterized protein n=1 Tax=Tothia fuscella TaxID=1048955 RepID=A0A9P4NX49_9PEZI|nr:hypothetical protein EJ08DRAFT_676382 [Tothia fuscella]
MRSENLTREFLLVLIRELGSIKSDYLHLLISSRDQLGGDIDAMLSPGLPWTTFEMEPRLVRLDIGLFLWTSLQLKTLKRLEKFGYEDVEQLLNKLPADLDETFARIVANIHEIELPQDSQCAQVAGFRPTITFIEQLAEASSPSNSDLERSTFVPLDAAILVDFLQDLILVRPRPDLLKAGKALSPQTYTIVLAHASGQDFELLTVYLIYTCNLK